MTAAKLRPLARELNARARYLRLADLDDPALVAAMSDYMANIRIFLNAVALAELKKEGKCPEETLHRQVKYLNNVIEADHGKLKQLIRPVRGFKTLKTAYATIKGLASVRRLWPRRSSLSANGSRSRRRNRPPDSIGRFARPQPENCNRAVRCARAAAEQRPALDQVAGLTAALKAGERSGAVAAQYEAESERQGQRRGLRRGLRM